MKRILAAILILVLVLALAPAVVNAEEEENPADIWLRVGLKYGSTAVTSAALTCEDGFLIARYDAETRSPVFVQDLEAYKGLKAVAEDGVAVLRDNGGDLLLQDVGDYVFLSEGESRVNYDGKAYRGGFMFTVNKDGTMNVINCVHMEDYLCGVLNAEMGYWSPAEALKAQAVAARSYALNRLNYHKAYGFDICPTTHCQVYRGVSSEHDETTAAVEATKGMLLYYEDEAVSGYYAMNSGGYTQSAKDVWGFDRGYLVSAPDVYSPDYAWTATYTLSEMTDKLLAAGYSFGQLKAVEVSEKRANASVSKVRFYGSSGTVDISVTQLRSILGATIIKSDIFTIDSEKRQHTTGNKFEDADAGQGTPDAILASLFIRSNAESATADRGKFYARTSSGMDEVGADKIYVLTASGKQLLSGKTVIDVSEPEENTALNAEPQKISSDTFYFNGLGYGHGIGMAQDSAIKMANLGFTYDEILKYFYKGIEIR